MFQTTYAAVQYTSRREVLHHLAVLMRVALRPAERRTVLLHCGIGVAQPMPFQDIAAALAMPTPGHAQACYVRAVQKTRAAIPGSKLERYVAYYAPPGQNGQPGRSAQSLNPWPPRPGVGRPYK